MGNQVIEAYQKKWKADMSRGARAAAQERVYQAFDKLFARVLREKFQGEILDIGSGDGALVSILNNKSGISCRGVDIDQGVNFEKDRLPFHDDEFDIIIMYSVIEHLYDPGNLLAEVKRICKSKGKIIVVTSNYDQTNPFTYDRAFFNDPTHVHPYNYRSIESLMSLYNMRKRFIGLWTAGKSTLLWRLPSEIQFFVGAMLPFKGEAKHIPSFLKGRSKSMLCVFENE